MAGVLYVQDCPDQANVDELLSMLSLDCFSGTLFWLDGREIVEEDGIYMIFYGGGFPASRQEPPQFVRCA